MRCERPYRPAMSDQEARDELARGAGTQFDRRCVETFDAHLNELRVTEAATAALRAA